LLVSLLVAVCNILLDISFVSIIHLIPVEKGRHYIKQDFNSIRRIILPT